MPKDRKVEATNVASPNASPRSSPRKAGQQAQDEFTKRMQSLVQGLEKVMQLEIEPNVSTINNMLNKKDKKKLN